MAKWAGSSRLEQALSKRGAQARLARDLGVDASNVSRWIRGVEPDPETVRRIEASLGLPAGTLGSTQRDDLVALRCRRR